MQVRFMDMDLIFKINKPFRPKRAYSAIYDFVKANFKDNEYEQLKKGFECLHNIKQKHYVLELYDPIYKGLESYCFSLYKDNTGYYTIYKNRIKHFHSSENAIKYQCSKHIVDSKLSSEKLHYVCLENSKIDKNESFREYINRSYSNRKRIFII